MTHIGSPAQWIGFIETQVPDILDLIVSTWESMPSPAGNELEDPISESLCRSLRQSRTSRDLPFRIDTQLVELDPAAGQDQGRMDIVFSPPLPREDIYFCLECKRLNVRSEDGVRPYFSEYVRYGVSRFVAGQYSYAVRNGGMLGIVLDGNVPAAITGIESNFANSSLDLGMETPAAFQASSVRPTDSRARETRHRRGHHPDLFVVHHLFVAGDPNAPLRSFVSNDPHKPKGRSSTTKRPRRKDDAR